MRLRSSLIAAVSALAVAAPAHRVVWPSPPEASSPDGARRPVDPQDPDPAEALAMLFEPGGIEFEPDRGRFSIPAEVATRDDLLEFLLVGERGSAYESLFATDADPTLLNTAILALGLTAGRNATWVFADGSEVAPAEGERADAEGAWLGDREVRLQPPSGDGILLYVGWLKDDEPFLFRVEDLIGNLEDGGSLPRQRFTYIGSRFIDDPQGEGEVFLAALEQNLISIAWFPEGNTLATGTDPVCERQDIWVGNPWLVPEPGTSVRLIFSRDPIATVPTDVVELLAGDRDAVGRAEDDGSDG